MTNLNESHRRHLAVSIRHIGGLLDDAERALTGLTPEKASVIRDAIARVRGMLASFADRFQIPGGERLVDAIHTLIVRATMAQITVDEMRARSLRGYGPIEDQTAGTIDGACDDLQRALRDLESVIANG